VGDRGPHDPSGFDCMDCHLRYPWIASADEGEHWHLCRACLSRRPSSRRGKAKSAMKRRRCKDCGSYMTVSQIGRSCAVCDYEKDLVGAKNGSETHARNAFLRRTGVEPPPSGFHSPEPKPAGSLAAALDDEKDGR
jgi:hypothetical protein